MSQAAKQFITVAGGLIAAFLVLSHFTGFGRDVGSLSTGTIGIIKQLQGG